jgi:hypothetical protein
MIWRGRIRRSVSIAVLCWGCVVASHIAYAQTSTAYIAYVAMTSGATVASNDPANSELDVLAPIRDGERLRLDDGAELRICHYLARRIFTLRGPLHALIFPGGVFALDARGEIIAGDSCAPPLLSTVQGGVALRKIGDDDSDDAEPETIVTRPKIKLIFSAARQIRRAVLQDARRSTIVAFDRGGVFEPRLADGSAYSILIEFADGAKWTMRLRASRAAATQAIIVSAK